MNSHLSPSSSFTNQTKVFTKYRLWLWIDVCSACNLQCSLCYTQSIQKKQYLTINVLERLLQAILNCKIAVPKVHLSWKGEPTLNPYFPEILKTFWKMAPFFDIEWHTNATLLTEDYAAKIISAHPRQKIMLSLDGGNKHSYEQNRGHGTWSRALAGSEAILKARKSEPSVSIGVYQLDLGVSPTDYDPRFTVLLNQIDSFEIKKPVRDDGLPLDVIQPGNVPTGPCFWVGNAIAIQPNGDVFTCILKQGTQIGNILQDSIESLIARAQNLRENISSEGRQNAIYKGCRECFKQEGVPH